MKALVLDPFSGVSGDMVLGALIDVGAPVDVLHDVVTRVPALSKVKVEASVVQRGPLRATSVRVDTPHEHAHRTLAVIRKLIEEAALSPKVKKGAVDTFTRLAAAEAKVHGIDIEAVHFHEVGALDAIVDIVGAHALLEHLGVEKGFTRPFALGSGSAESEHGAIPVPAPATVELLSGFPVYFTELNEELVTPTGAAIVAANFAPLPTSAMVTAERTGYGAGTRERDGIPNVLRVIAGTVVEGKGRVCIVTSTIDNMNPELYGDVMERLFGEGALEVYYNPIIMKKNRPGVEVTVISEEKDLDRVAQCLLTHTTTLGLRVHREERIELARRKDSVDTAFGRIAVKIAERPGGQTTVSPEYESCREAAKRANVSVIEVFEAARRAWDASNES